MKIVRYIIVIAIGFLMSGCVSNPTVANYNTNISANGQGVVYFYTPSSVRQNLTASTPVTATDSDGKKTYIGKVGSGSPLIYYAKPGMIKFSNSNETFFGDNAFSKTIVGMNKVMPGIYKEVSLNIEAGKKYCIHAEMPVIVAVAGVGGVFLEEPIQQCETVINQR